MPTGNLDTATSHDVIGLLKLAAKQFQQTVVLITHDNDVAQMSDRIVRIEDGRIVERSGAEREKDQGTKGSCMDGSKADAQADGEKQEEKGGASHAEK